MTDWPDVPVKPAAGVVLLHSGAKSPSGNSAQPAVEREAHSQALSTIDRSRPDFSESAGCHADDGNMTLWHTSHYGGIAQRGPGMMMIEATGVVPEGRTTPGCVGLWKDSQIAPIKQVIDASQKYLSLIQNKGEVDEATASALFD
ncbi:hypothetical protein BDV10DRAFT_184001 [Aspergillus recurvatus]